LEPIFLITDYKEQAAALKGKPPAPEHVDRYIREDRALIMPDGNVTAAFIEQVIDPGRYEKAYQSLWEVAADLPDHRPTAVGTRSMRRQRKDGTLTNFTGVHGLVKEVLKKRGERQGLLGYVGGKGQLRHSEQLDENRSFIELVDREYSKYFPCLHAEQRTIVLGRQLWETVFATIYLNKQIRTAYHPDGNLRGFMTAITAMGDFSGGALVLPRWRVAFDMRPGDLLFFDAEELHGNLPISGKRLSAVFYCPRRQGSTRS
jgi:hypothetical protein